MRTFGSWLTQHLIRDVEVHPASRCIRRLLSSVPCAVFVDALMKVHGTRDIALEVRSYLDMLTLSACTFAHLIYMNETIAHCL